MHMVMCARKSNRKLSIYFVGENGRWYCTCRKRKNLWLLKQFTSVTYTYLQMYWLIFYGNPICQNTFINNKTNTTEDFIVISTSKPLSLHSEFKTVPSRSRCYSRLSWKSFIAFSSRFKWQVHFSGAWATVLSPRHRNKKTATTNGLFLSRSTAFSTVKSTGLL